MGLGSVYIEVEGPYQLIDYRVQSVAENKEACDAKIKVAENEIDIHGEGSGPIDAFVEGLVNTLNEPLRVVDYQEYSLNECSEAQAICILSISDYKQNKYYGVGIRHNTTTAAFKSIIAAINRKWQ